MYSNGHENKMDLIDVTLRDGGHAVNFDWDPDIVKEYYDTVSKIKEITYIEMGYWKQTVKSKNRFYNLNIDILNNILGENPYKKVSIMIDYHYCNKDYKEYPTKNQNIVGMIRVCSRKNDLDEALLFAQGLKEYTGLKVSLNVFNISNYTEAEINQVVDKVTNFDLDYVYFADTHGSLDFSIDGQRFVNGVRKLRKNGIKVGMHLHDHRGKAFSNFKMLKEIGFTGFDASTRGMGKGVGNLKLENVISEDDVVSIMNFASKHEKQFTMRESPYGAITALHSITDYYGYYAEKKNIPLLKFNDICKSITGTDKDVFNVDLLKR